MKTSNKSYFKKIDFNSENLGSLPSSSLKKIADHWLRQFLLSKTDIKNGMIFCPLKKRWFSVEKMQVSHFLDRGNLSTRFELDNCHLISEQSNCFDSKQVIDGFKSLHHKEYEEFLLFEIGEKRLEELKNKNNSLEVFTKDDYIAKINFFRDECRK